MPPEGDLDFDWSLFSGNEGADLSGIDLSSLGNDYNFNPADYPDAFASGDLSGLLNADNVDLSSLLNPADYPDAFASGDLSALLNASSELTTPDGVNEEFLKNLSPEERARYQAMQAEDYKAPTYEGMNQDFGGADTTKYLDEFNENFNPAGGYGSQWQTVGTNRVMVNDDGTSTILNPTTGETSYLDKDQTDALVNNGTLNSKNSGYVAATGGKGDIPGGGKTVINKDGSKTVTTTDGKTYKIGTDGKVTDLTKIIKDTVTNTKTVGGGGVGTNTKATTPTNNNGMLMALLALMAMMNKGGGSSTGSGAVIPSLQADRKQLPYGPTAGLPAVRPGAGGVNYFSPTTYTQKAAGGGMMYGSGGISDLGGYSDGGRLLKGPGDGVSDSIPATIGGKQPARLAEGEFVVPARVVSELGNGSTDAGAQKLYAMMDRVQKARRKTKNVAADTKAHKYLPA